MTSANDNRATNVRVPASGPEMFAKAIHANFTSPNVGDANLEPANVVDVLNYCANGLLAMATALDRIATVMEGRRP